MFAQHFKNSVCVCVGGVVCRELGDRQAQCSKQEEHTTAWHSPGTSIKGLINLKYFSASEALD